MAEQSMPNQSLNQSSQRSLKRSNEPVFWALFGAGGVVAAFLLPAVILITGLAAPLGIPSPELFSYERASAFASSWAGALFLFIVISLSLWHGLHRVYHSSHELGIHRGPLLSVIRLVCYGTALGGTVLSAYWLIAAL